MKIGIIGAMEEEIKILHSQLKSSDQKIIAGFTFHIGMLNHAKVILVEGGIGKVNTSTCVTLLISHFGCTHIINTGSAAGLNKDLGIGDAVVSTEICYFDVDVTPFNYQLGQVPSMPARYLANSEMLALTKNNNIINCFNIIEGLILSGDAFVTDTRKIQENFPEASALEMEAGGVAQTCHRFNTPFIVIRAISDSGDKDAHITHDEFLVIASKNSAELVFNLVTAMHEEEMVQTVS